MKSKIIIPFLFVLMLSGCGIFHAYQPYFHQGNDYTMTQASKIKKGMTRGAVLTVLGSPVYVNTFRDNTWDYVYRIQKGPRVLHDSYIIVHFSQGRVVSVERKQGQPIPPRKKHGW